MKLIKRADYLARLMRLRNTPDIKVIVGVRRSGKSVLIKQFIESLQEEEQEANIIFINLQDLDYSSLLDYKKLHQYVLDRYEKDKHNLLLIDEVQLCDKFELAINSLHSKSMFDIYLTGSNAFLLSSDLATLFTGRAITIEVFPFSFKEFLAYKGTSDKESLFDEYLEYGGMPGSLSYEEDEDKTNYLKEVYNTILLRDLVEKYRIRNVNELSKISLFMLDNVGKLLSPNNISSALNKDGSSITRKTVSNYLSYFENSFMFYRDKRYDLKGKRYLSSSDKYYLCDIGFKYAINGTKNMDYGSAIENIVFLELLRRGYTAYVGKLYQKEVDFVAISKEGKIYIQVSEYIDNEETFKRECSSLLAIRDAYPKIIIARTHHDEYLYEGIRIIDLVKWLSEE